MRRSLVVDDSRIIRKVAASILAGHSFECAEAEDGGEALSACRAQMPDLVLIDANMPNSNAFEFLRNLRREPGGSVPVAIYCTTENDTGRIQEALACGANDYLLKPFDQVSMREALSLAGLI